MGGKDSHPLLLKCFKSFFVSLCKVWDTSDSKVIFQPIIGYILPQPPRITLMLDFSCTLSAPQFEKWYAIVQYEPSIATDLSQNIAWVLTWEGRCLQSHLPASLISHQATTIRFYYQTITNCKIFGWLSAWQMVKYGRQGQSSIASEVLQILLCVPIYEMG